MTFQTNELWRYKRKLNRRPRRKLTSTLQRSVFSIRLHKFAFAVDLAPEIRLNRIQKILRKIWPGEIIVVTLHSQTGNNCRESKKSFPNNAIMAG